MSAKRGLQVLLGKRTYAKHDSVYGSGLAACGHCGRPIVVEIKQKRGKEYTYYWCAGYTVKVHPRERGTGGTLDEHMLSLFDRLRIEDKQILQWLQRVIREKMKSEVAGNTAHLREIQRQIEQVNKDRDALLTLRMHREIEPDTYSRKDNELQKSLARFRTKLEGQAQQKTEIGDTAIKVLELSQSLRSKWVSADIDEKRVILEIVGLNYELKHGTLCVTMRKPFDAIVKGLQMNIGSGGRI